MQTRKASIKETGEELSQAEWDRFDAAIAETHVEKLEPKRCDRDAAATDHDDVEPSGSSHAELTLQACR